MTALPRALSALALLVLTACPKRVAEETGTKSGPPRAFQLLQETAERETTQIAERREDIEVDTHDFDRIPRVVATGETPLIRLDGARARLYGDADGKEGWSVDNFVLLEVVDEQSRVLARGSIGFAQGVLIGADRVDNLGRMAFRFDPGEVEVTALLPDWRPFKVRATALDNGGVGRVSNLYLVLEYPSRTRGAEEDLSGE